MELFLKFNANYNWSKFNLFHVIFIFNCMKSTLITITIFPEMLVVEPCNCFSTPWNSPRSLVCWWFRLKCRWQSHKIFSNFLELFEKLSLSVIPSEMQWQSHVFFFNSLKLFNDSVSTYSLLVISSV